MERLTDKQKKVLELLSGQKSVHGLIFKEIIFSEETIKRWSHSRRHKIIIETMTFSYLGKMVKKGLLDSDFHGNYSITIKGRKLI